MDKRNIRQSFKKFLLGSADPQTTDVIDNWYQSFDNESIGIFSGDDAATTKHEIWGKITRELGTGVPASGLEPTPTKKIWHLPRLMKVAAMFLVLAGAAGGYWIYQHSKADCCGTTTFTTISTGIGERKKMTIEDGSQLVLDAGTTIRVQDGFVKNRRIELLDGQVFFDVRRDEQHPFVIESGGLTTTVLGTSFNIAAFKALNTLSIGVITGKVSVKKGGDASNILEKQQELVYNKTSKTFKTIPLDESITSWQDGRLVFNDLSFGEMSAIVRKNFAIDIQTDDESVRLTRYTTELPGNMKPEEAMEILAAIHNLRIKRTGDKVLFYKTKKHSITH